MAAMTPPDSTAKVRREIAAGDPCPCCANGRISTHQDYIRCNNCGWMRYPESRQVMNPPADEAEAGNLTNTAPRQAEHDAACRGLSGTTSCPEARPVTATAQTSPPPSPATPTLAEQIEAQSRFLIYLDDRQTPRESLTYAMNAAILASLTELASLQSLLVEVEASARAEQLLRIGVRNIMRKHLMGCRSCDYDEADGGLFRHCEKCQLKITRAAYKLFASDDAALSAASVDGDKGEGK